MYSKSRLLTALIVAILTLGVLTAGYCATLIPVTLVVNGERHTVATHQPSVGLLLADLHIALRPEDRVTPNLETPLTAGMEIHVERAHPVVVVVDGRTYVLYTRQDNPADLLNALGVSVGERDRLSMHTPLISDPPNTRFRLIVERAVQLTLEEGNVRTSFHTTAATVGEALLQAGVQLYRADRLFPDPATPVRHGMHIRLERSTPVTVQVDGHTLRTRTHRSRVGEVLADLGVTLNGLDYTIPPLDTPLGGGSDIQVIRVSESVIVEQSPIPFDSVWRPDPDWELDHQRLLQEGEPGVLERRIRVRYENGQIVARWEEGSSVVKAPVDRVMGYGTKIVVRQLQTGSGTVEYWRVLRMLATSYSASTSGVSPSSPHYGRTATGMQMRRGIVAVDPNVIPLHTKVYVPGYGIGLAADTGGAIRGKRIDLGYNDDDLELWYAWVNVYLLTPIPDQINYFIP